MNNFLVIVISSFGRQAELPGSQRIYSLLKGFHDNNVETHLITPNLPYITLNDLSEFQVHVINKGIFQYITIIVLSLIQNILRLRKFKSDLSFKPAYKKGSLLIAYYTFLFYSKQIIPLYRSYKLAKKLCVQAIKKNRIPIVITSTSPGSYLLLGYYLKKYFGNSIIWIADYRDPLEDNPILNYPDNFIYYFTDNVTFKYSDLIISPESTFIKIITNTAKKRGFDITNKTYVLKNCVIPKKKLRVQANNTKSIKTIFYGGTVYLEQLQGLKILFESLKERTDYRFIYAGYTPEIVIKTLHETGLQQKKFEVFDVLSKPDYERLLSNSDVLLALGTFIDSYKITGGKLRSLLGYDKPILIVSPKTSELIHLSQEAGGIYLAELNKNELKSALEKISKDLNSKTTFRNKDFLISNSAKVIVEKFLRECLIEVVNI